MTTTRFPVEEYPSFSENLFSSETSAIVGFEECKKYHPRFHFEVFTIPPWLKQYKVIHIIKGQDNPTIANAVHKLFHVVLDNQLDRLQMADAIRVGETIAIVRPGAAGLSGNALIPVAAITFAPIGLKIVVLFLSVDPSYQKAGFGTQLLMLTGECVRQRFHHSQDPSVSMFLYANEDDNSNAWQYYTARGFEVADVPSEELLQDFFSNPELEPFVRQEFDELKLMCLDFKTICFSSTAAKTPSFFLLDRQRPLHGVLNDPMIYAQFPGIMSLADYNHCGQNLVLLGAQHRCFQAQDDSGSVGITNGYPKSQFVVSWSSRIEIKAGYTLLNPTASMLLAWIQRDPEARIWKDRVTLLPTCVMMALFNMHFLLQRYLASMIIQENHQEMKSSTFHSEFDNERFIGFAKIVLNFILVNRTELFAKPYIVMFGENMNMDWKCFISVNAGTISTVNAKYEPGSTVCGFIHFDPIAEDAAFRSTAIEGEDPHLFFLTLTHHVLSTVDEGQSELLFDDVQGFLNFYSEAEFDFGNAPYGPSMASRDSFYGYHNFVQLALPEDYPLRVGETVVHHSKLASILFFIDFCISVAGMDDFHWRSDASDTVVAPVSGINPKKPLSRDKQYIFAIPKDYPFGSWVMPHVTVGKSPKTRKKIDNFRKFYALSTQRIMNTMLNCTVALIDRIATTQHGADERKARKEFKHLKCRSNTDIGTLPALHKSFTDRAFILNWTASEKPRDVSTPTLNSEPSAVSASSPSTADEASHAPAGEEPRGFATPTLNAEPSAVSAAPPSTADEVSPHDAPASEKPRDAAACPTIDTESSSAAPPSSDDEATHAPAREKSRNVATGSLPPIIQEPPELKALPSPRKRSFPNNKKRVWSSADVAVAAAGPKNTSLEKKSKGARLIEKELETAMLLKQGKDAPSSICVAGDECHSPGGSSELSSDLDKCAPCSECNEIGHFICLRKVRTKRYCPKCYLVVNARRRHLALQKVRNDLAAKRDREIHLQPPPELLLDVSRFVRPDVSKRMKATLDVELSERDFLTEDEMRAKILAHNTKLQELRDHPNLYSLAQQKCLKNEAINIKRETLEWKKCYRELHQDFVRSTRCCVKELRYDGSNFIARMEWAESGRDVETGEEFTVTNRETMVVKDQWVKDNFTSGVYCYLKRIPAMSDGAFLPVPYANVALDTRQISHFKWAVSKDHPEGRWIVKFANSDETEEMHESDLLAAVGLGPMEMAKVFSKGRKGGFLPIPVGNSTGARAVDIVSDIQLAFPQHSRQTCIYSSFASALWFLGMTDLALLVFSQATESEGDPHALKKLASLVHDHPTWLIPRRIKSAEASFNILQHDLTNSLAVVVLKGTPDGACNHAITVHDGLIFDSNEECAVLLTRANLDLMCSTDNRIARFKCVTSGYTFIDSRNGFEGIRDLKMQRFYSAAGHSLKNIKQTKTFGK